MYCGHERFRTTLSPTPNHSMAAFTEAGLLGPKSRLGAAPQLSAVAQRINQQGKRLGGLTTARIVEVIPGKRRTPVGKHPHEMPGIDVGLSLFLSEVGQAKPGPCRRENEGGCPEHELYINP